MEDGGCNDITSPTQSCGQQALIYKIKIKDNKGTVIKYKNISVTYTNFRFTYVE